MVKPWLPLVRAFHEASDPLTVVAYLAVGLAAFQLVGLLLVILAETVPDALVADALVEGIHKGQVTQTEHPRTGLDNRVDRWTECIALTVGLGDPTDSNKLKTAIISPQLGKCGLAVPALLAYQDGKPLVSHYNYYRYWHGYTIVTRPSLALFGVAGTRMTALVLMLASIIGLVLLVGRDTTHSAALLLVAPLILSTGFIDFPESTPHALAMATVALGALVTWVLVMNQSNLKNMVVGGLFAGSLAAYVDLMVLFSGSMAWVIFLIMAAAYQHGWRGFRLLMAGTIAGLSWVIGFATTWCCKWIIAGTVVGFDTVFKNVFHQVSFRLNGEWNSVSHIYGEAARLNIDYWLDRPLGTLVVVAGLVAAGVFLIRGLSNHSMSLASATILTVPVFVPILWFEALSNHSQIHFWFTYRSLALALGGLLFVLYVASCPKLVNEKTRERYNS
jgi:hypothetical protein